jgi:ankyrin repeat protein
MMRRYAVQEACCTRKLDVLRVMLDATPAGRVKELQQCAFNQLCSMYCDKLVMDHTQWVTSVKPLLQYLLEIGVDVNYCEVPIRYSYEHQNLTALSCMIAQECCSDGVRWLVSTAGADVNVVWGWKKWSALHAVCKRNWRDTDTELITTLLDLGADVRLATSSGDTVLHTAVSEAAVAVLEAVVVYCNSGAAADQAEQPLIAQQENREGHTPLHAAVVKRSGEAEPIDMLRVLLSCKDSHLAAALVKQDKSGRTVLHLAVKLRLMEEIQLLLAACLKTAVLQTVLHMKDNKGQTLVALVRCMRGESLLSVLAPHCEEVCNCATTILRSM